MIQAPWTCDIVLFEEWADASSDPRAEARATLASGAVTAGGKSDPSHVKLFLGKERWAKWPHNGGKSDHELQASAAFPARSFLTSHSSFSTHALGPFNFPPRNYDKVASSAAASWQIDLLYVIVFWAETRHGRILRGALRVVRRTLLHLQRVRF